MNLPPSKTLSLSLGRLLFTDSHKFISQRRPRYHLVDSGIRYFGKLKIGNELLVASFTDAATSVFGNGTNSHIVKFRLCTLHNLPATCLMSKVSTLSEPVIILTQKSLSNLMVKENERFFLFLRNIFRNMHASTTT